VPPTGDTTGGPLIRRVEGAQRFDLVAEELHADRQLERRRKDIDDAAAASELASSCDLDHRRVPEIEQVPQQCILAQPHPDPERRWSVGQIRRRDGVLEQRLDTRDEDPGSAGPPGRQGRDAGGRLIRHELRPFVGERGPWLQRYDGSRVTQPRTQLLCHPVTDLCVTGNPHERLRRGEGGRQERLRAVRDTGQPGVVAQLGASDVGGDAEALPQGRERGGPGEQRRQCRQIREPMPRTGGGTTSDGPRPPAGRRRCRRGPGVRSSPAISRLGFARVGDLRVHGRDIEVDGMLDGRGLMACRERIGDLLRETSFATAAAAQGWE
jgi:hypothetical protein